MYVRAYAKNIFIGSRLSAAVTRCGSDRRGEGEDFHSSTSFSFYLQYFQQCVIFDIELT